MGKNMETANFLLGLAGAQSVVVIWRDTAGLDLGAEAAFAQEEILRLPKSSETLEVWKPDRVYVNGDSLIPNAQPIEAVFVETMRQPILPASGN